MSRLQLASEILDLKGKEPLDCDGVHELIRSLGISMEHEEISRLLDVVEGLRQRDPDAADASSSESTLRRVAKAVRLAELQPGRHYVVLTLAEAEAVRVLLHARKSSASFLPGNPGCCVALRLLRRSPLELSLLDASPGWQDACFRQQELSAAASLLFLAAEMRYSHAETELLWRTLRTSPWEVRASGIQPDLLRDFFLASSSVRRRRQPADWQSMPVAKLFMTEDEHRRARRKAVLSEAYARLSNAGVDPQDAFKVLDSDCDGRAVPADFRSPQALSLGLPPQLWVRLFCALSAANCGAVAVDDWTGAFLRDQSGPRTALNTETSTGGSLPVLQAVPLNILRRIRIERVNHTAYTPVWSSEGTTCHKRVSIWAADQLVSGYMRVTALRLNLGHYANQGFSGVRGGGSAGVSRRQILQIRDTSWGASGIDESLRAVADHYCPCPVKFRQVWDQQQGTPVFVWRPVPPSEAFVALGMVATATPEPPPLDSVRCVAKSFCQPVRDPPVHVWDDVGGGGRPGSFWLVNSTQALWAVEGHGAPQDAAWDLAEDSAFFDAAGRPSVELCHERGAPPARRADE